MLCEGVDSNEHVPGLVNLATEVNSICSKYAIIVLMHIRTSVVFTYSCPVIPLSSSPPSSITLHTLWSSPSLCDNSMMDSSSRWSPVSALLSRFKEFFRWQRLLSCASFGGLFHQLSQLGQWNVLSIVSVGGEWKVIFTWLHVANKIEQSVE